VLVRNRHVQELGQHLGVPGLRQHQGVAAMDCPRCRTPMALSPDEHYRCRCGEIMHVSTAAFVAFLLALSVTEVVAYAEEHLAWCRGLEDGLGWRECYAGAAA